ncbi:MAG TPA: TadE/TadG family type IV pilus assembly protein [Acidobacteriaceae bacterium]|nr:TadE/TadG family type IV pilus assembly protein [Acidobacteriaceae bacterium]
MRLPDGRLTALLRTLRGEQGSTMVEFALSAVVLLTLIFGILGMCLALYSYHYVADASREGTRYAIVRGKDCSTYGNFSSDCPVVNSSAVQTYVRGLSFPGINSSNLVVNAAWSVNGTTWSSTANPNNVPGDLVKVTVSYQLPMAIPFVPARTLTMSSTSEMVIAD